MLEILNASIAVTAHAHNPSILHPSFLIGQGIVPSDWTEAESPVCTPALSIVKFANDIVMTVEPAKLQVIDNAVSQNGDGSNLSSIVERYVRTLPHVRYTAVGINFSALIEDADADASIKKFVAAGPWNDAKLRPTTLGVRFVYDALGIQMRLAIDTGTVQGDERKPARKGVVLAANYHADAADSDRVAAAAGRFLECLRHFEDTVATIFDLRTQHAH